MKTTHISKTCFKSMPCFNKQVNLKLIKKSLHLADCSKLHLTKVKLDIYEGEFQETMKMDFIGDVCSRRKIVY